jgi:hypothetical protein
MEILIGAVAAIIFFLLAYKLIRPSKEKKLEAGPTNHFVCDVCKGNICECRPENESNS